MSDSSPVRSPRDVPAESVRVLVQAWGDACIRTCLATHAGVDVLDPEDLFIDLAYGARIAQEVTAGRWCAVAKLLQIGQVQSWAQLGAAMHMTETQARDGFHEWIAGQVDLRRRTGTIGLSADKATELHALSEALPW